MLRNGCNRISKANFAEFLKNKVNFYANVIAVFPERPVLGRAGCFVADFGVFPMLILLNDRTIAYR
jgi:hypothetical protein